MPPPVPPSVKLGRTMTGKPIFAGEFEAVFEVVDQRGFRNVEADALHRIFEDQAVFGLLDGTDLRADELHVVFLEHAAVGKFDGEIQRGLSADGRQNREAGAAATSRARCE